MGDEAIRELERRWRQGGDVEDEGRWLLARVRGGQLSQGALDAAAWLGAPGAVRAAPGAAELPRAGDPWAALMLWSAGLDARLRTIPEASHRAVLAEAERLLALVEASTGRWTARLLIIEGPRSGEHVPLAGTVYLDRHGREVEPPAAALALAADAEGWMLRPRTRGAVLVNGDPVADVRLHHGDLIAPGGAGTLLIVDAVAGEPDPAPLRHVRAWLDELTARVADPAVAPGPRLRQVRLEGVTAGPGTWLNAQLPALDVALRERRPLACWPAHLSPPEALREAWAREIRTTLRAALGPWLLREADPLRARAEDAVDQLRIASPCSMRWEELTHEPDDPRVRRCDRCELQVFDLAQLTRAEATALLAARTGRLCVRLYQRPDGRVMTRDCATAPQRSSDELLLDSGDVAASEGQVLMGDIAG